MHYYIDGYNMLFRLVHAGDNLQSQREAIIHDLNQKIELVRINVSIVFDAAFQPGGYRTRSHFNRLEILYTDEGELADDFIIDELKTISNPRQETVVTSDKKLAWRARSYSAHTESVESFIAWLNKSYKNKLRLIKTGESPLPLKPALKPPTPVVQPVIPSKIIHPTDEASIEQCTSYYEQVFEKRFQELLKEEPISKRKKEKLSHPPKKEKKKKHKVEQPLVEGASNEMERWLKAFEHRIDTLE